MQIAYFVVQRRVDDMTHLFRCTGLHGELCTFNPHHISTGDDHEVVSMDSTPSGTSAVVLHSRCLLLKSNFEFFLLLEIVLSSANICTGI